MIKIAIVDDEEQTREQILRTLKENIQKQHEVEIKLYASGESFFEEIQKGEAADILFTDIQLQQLDGVELGKLVRRLCPDIYIVFITSYEEYAAESYRIEAYQYILKQDLEFRELLIASPWAYVGNVWSQTAASIGYGSNNHLTVPVSIKTMEMTTPYKCAICVVFLMLFYSLFITLVMLVLNLQKGRAGGVVGALLINLYGILLTPDIFQKIFHLGGGLSYRANVLCGWLSPLNHATFPMHNFGYDYLPQIKTSILLFLAGICILLFISRKCIKRYNFTFSQVDES